MDNDNLSFNVCFYGQLLICYVLENQTMSKLPYPSNTEEWLRVLDNCAKVGPCAYTLAKNVYYKKVISVNEILNNILTDLRKL